MQAVFRERNSKHIPPTTYTHAIEESVSKQRIGEHTTIGVLLETVFSLLSMQSGYKEEFRWEDLVEFRDASPPGYKLGSRGNELKESLEVAVGRIIETMARKELDCAKKASCVI
jgi:hypothetical protein